MSDQHDISTDTETLIKAVRIIAKDIGGCFTESTALLEAAGRLEEQHQQLREANILSIQVPALIAHTGRLRCDLEEYHAQYGEDVIAKKYQMGDALQHSPEQSLVELQTQAIQSFKDELIKSVSVIYRPHIEGVCAVVIERLSRTDQEAA